MVQWLMNPTGNHEVAGSIPDLAKPVKVADVAQIPHCCGSGVGLWLQLRQTPSLGTSIYCRYGPRKSKKTKKDKKKKKLQWKASIRGDSKEKSVRHRGKLAITGLSKKMICYFF